MKTFSIFVVMMAICMLMTGCGKHTNPSASTTPSGNPTVVANTGTEEPASQDTNGTTETTSQGNANSGDYVSSDSRITPVRLEDYWISDTQFDFINYCKDQGATVKYCIPKDDNSGNTYCLPEDLSSTGKTPIAICAFFYFGGDKEYVTVYWPFGDLSDQYWVTSDVAFYEPCINSIHSADDDVRIVIDNYGNTLSLSTINHLPVMFEYMMVLPTDATAQDIVNTFNAHYDN